MADPRRGRRRALVGLAWVGGTALAMTASIVAMDAAGTKVTSPASYATAHVGQAADVRATATSDAGSGSTAARGAPSPDAPSSSGGGSSAAATAGSVGGSTAESGSSGAGVASTGSPVTSPSRSSTSPGPGGTGPAGSPTTSTSTPPTTAAAAGTTTTEAPPPSSSASKSVTGGSFQVQCIGNQMTLQSVTPSAGWSAETSRPSASSVHVEFDQGESSTEVDATCSAGKITFVVDS